MKVQIIILSISLMCLFSCFPSDKAPVGKQAFFDISAFVDQQLAKKHIYSSVERTISLNGQPDKKVYTDFDISNGLNSLKKFNINNSLWFDKYQVLNKGFSTSYIALDSSMNVKKVVIDKIDNKVNRIRISHSIETLISTARKEVDYYPGKTLSTRTISKSKMGEEQDLILDWKFSN